MAPRGRYNKGRGRGGGGRGRGRGRGGGGGGSRNQQPDNRVSFQDVVKKNEKFERFYDALNIVPAGQEREQFWEALRRELPNSFRFTGSKGHALGVRNNLVERFFPLIQEIKHHGEPVELPKPILWYPEGLAYSMTTPKNVVRKYEPFKEFQKFLVSETGVGNISRQEHVSMIPPLVLDVRPGHTVLDLCAAPGSKSAQLIEAIHAGEEERVARAIDRAKGEGVLDGESVVEDGGRTTGLLVANDVNYQRAQMLVHQVKRLNSPNLIVTNHDATMFPSIELPSPPPAPGQQKKGAYLKFDRILADVPCSGDGTTRKNPSIWKDWTPQNGLGLYITQTRILTRSLQMLKVGGRVVYSTCSMNPVENEAVISSAIERCGGIAKVRIVDCSDRLPNLVRNPGLEDWSIMARNGRMYESFPEAEQYEGEDSKIVPGMFAPEPEEQIPLKHCMRVYPHQQDTGGFFITVLEKVGEIRAKPESESKSMKRDWKFQASAGAEESSELVEKPETLVGQLIEEIEHPKEPVSTQGDSSSAAARQNKEERIDDDVLGAGTKRKAADDIDAASKRTKTLENGPDNYEMMQDANGRMLPPQVEMAVEAAGEQDVKTNGQTSNGTSVPTGHNSNNPNPPPRKRRRDNEPANEESFKYLDPEHAELESIYTFYEIHSSFPRDRFLVRNPAGDPVKGIYYSSSLVKDILQANEGRGMKFVHAGVKMFMKQDVQGQEGVCRWRIQTEGLNIVEGWTGEKRTVRLWKRSTLRKLLVEMFPRIGGEDIKDGQGWKALGEIGEQVLKMGMGCCVLRVVVKPDEGDDGFSEGFVLPLWRSLHSLNLMLPKEERKAMLLRLFEEDVELVNHTELAKRETKVRGSASGEADATEVQRKIAHMKDDDVPVPSGKGPANVIKGEVVEEGDVDLAAVAAEQDAIEAQDTATAAKAEVLEDEDTKISDAMPERVGEEQEMNTTV